ncbi:MAG: Protein of unknown function (DUF3616) [Verrucomicrobia bacterium]|nr:MAG: Protein of unknown function (DUF3616) [Verrucomicrobiota bacterium]
MRAAPLLTLLALAAPAVRLHAGPLTDGTQLFGTGFPELSAAAPAGPANSWLVVADNELPRLGLFNLASFPASLSAPALRSAQSGTLEVDDLEAVTIFPWDVDGDGKPEASYHVFAASCARTRGKGRIEPLRDALFAIRINPDAPPASAFPNPASIEYNRSLRSQIRSLGAEHSADPWGPILRNSVHSPGTKPDAPNASLSTESGLNIEGLSLSLDQSALLLALRSPLVNGLALLIPLTNPIGALGLGESQPQPASLSTPTLLNLNGLGFRSIERDPSGNFFWIAAGPASTDDAPFQLFTWNGNPNDPPQPIVSPAASLATSRSPEAIAIAPAWPAALVFSDGGSKLPFFRGSAIAPPPPRPSR